MFYFSNSKRLLFFNTGICISRQEYRGLTFACLFEEFPFLWLTFKSGFYNVVYKIFIFPSLFPWNIEAVQFYFQSVTWCWWNSFVFFPTLWTFPYCLSSTIVFLMAHCDFVTFVSEKMLSRLNSYFEGKIFNFVRVVKPWVALPHTAC